MQFTLLYWNKMHNTKHVRLVFFFHPRKNVRLVFGSMKNGESDELLQNEFIVKSDPHHITYKEIKQLINIMLGVSLIALY